MSHCLGRERRFGAQSNPVMFMALSLRFLGRFLTVRSGSSSPASLLSVRSGVLWRQLGSGSTSANCCLTIRPSRRRFAARLNSGVRPHVQKNRAHSHCSATDDSPKLLHLRRSIRRQRRFHQRLEQLQCRSIWLLAICISYHQVVVGIARALFLPCRHCHLETQETAYHSCIGLHLYWHHSFVLVCIRSFIAYPRMRPNNSFKPTPLRGAA